MLFWFRLTPFVLMLTLCRNLAAPASSGLRSWADYHTIMWIGDTASKHPEKMPLFLQRLREMGINTAMVYSSGDARHLVEACFPYYVENMVNRGLCLKFNSKVQDWDKFVTEWARNGRSESGLVRDYCLDDPQWLNSATSTLATIVRQNKDRQPLAYDIRDELSVTISANPFDYDFNPMALEHFRVWLKAQYPDLGALNAEWETRFNSWAEIRPFTTDQIKNRMATGDSLPRGQPDWQRIQQIRFNPADATKNPTQWNFSPWADFRTYMDTSLAKALDQMRSAVHALDPATPAGIEGTQMPSAFGGYDLWRLSQALDWVEPYDIGSAREIFGSFMPDRPILTTVFESENRLAARRLWHLLLEGDRGCLVWWSEDCIEWTSGDWQLTPKAQALSPVLREMTSPLAALFLRAKRETDPILIHYSQPSIQVDWLLESTVDGSTWLRRFSSFEAEHNQMAKTRTAWLKALQDLGYSPRFISSHQIEAGNLAALSQGVVVLPNSWALSETEERQFAAFAASGSQPTPYRLLLAEGPAGAFDEHAKLRGERPAGNLSNLAANQGCLACKQNGPDSSIDVESRQYLAKRLEQKLKSPWLDWLKQQLAPIPPPITIPASAHVRVYRFSIKQGRLAAFERNINYQMSEDLKQAGGNQALEAPVQVTALLLQPAHVYDLRAGTYLGLTSQWQFTLDAWRPSLFALLREKADPASLLSELAAELK